MPRVSVGTTVVKLIGPNPRRFSISIQNVGATILFFKFSIQPPPDLTTTNFDFQLDAGGLFTFGIIEDGDDILLGVYIIGNAAGGLAAVAETSKLPLVLKE